jgi:hypothetical protein
MACAAADRTCRWPLAGDTLCSRWPRTSNYVDVMPIVDVTYAPEMPEERLMRLAQTLPHAVSTAVECPEEPYEGDVEVRFRPKGPYDLRGLDILVEVRSKWFASRAETRQERCDQLCGAIIEAVGTRGVGVYLSLPVAAWSQVE